MTLNNKNLTIGILYLSLVLVGPVSLLLLPEMFGNATNISAYIDENIALFVLWIFADIIIIIIELFLTTYLYQVTRNLSKEKALYAYIARMGMIVVMLANMVLLVWILVSNQGNNTINSLLNLHHSGIYVWQIFFFAHLLFLGQVLLKESKLPKIISYGILIGSFAYLLDSIYYFTNLDISIISVIIGMLLAVIAISEVTFGIFLIIKRKELFHE